MAINSLSASSYGLSGLVSGINTQEVVEKLLSGTQSKIDKALQKKTVLQYKQKMYRDVATKLKTLQSSYLSYTSKTNLLSNSFFNTMAATVTPASGTSAAFSVTASSSATVGNSTMQYIDQLATAYTAKSSENASGGVAGAFDKAAASNLLKAYSGTNAQLSIKVGNRAVAIADAAAVLGGKNPSEVVAVLNDAFRNATPSGQAQIATASYVNNKLQITAANETDYINVFSSTGTNLAMSMFGSSAISLSAQGTFSSAIDTDLYQPSFTVNLDGRQESVHMSVVALRDYVENDNIAGLKDDISASLTHIFGTGVKLENDGDGFKLTTGQASQRVTVTGNSTMMGVLGLKSGISNKLSTTLAIKDLNFATGLQGDLHMFSINGVEFSYDSKATLGTIIKDINNSKAGVTVSYIESEDRFVLAKSETGAVDNANFKFDLEQTSGNLLSALFGAKGGDMAVGQAVNMTMVGNTLTQESLDAIARGGTFTFNINGTDYKISMPWDDSQVLYTPETFATRMNLTLGQNLGYMPDGKNAVAFTYADGKFSIRANNPDLTVKVVAQDKDSNKDLLGFTVGQTTRANNGDFTLEQAGIVFGTGAGITVNLDLSGTITPVTISEAEINASGTTFNDLADLINTKIAAAMPSGTPAEDIPTVTYDAKAAAFKVVGAGIPMEIVINKGTDSEGLDNLFGQMSLAVGQTYASGAATDYLVKTQDGQNAKFKLNGSEMERATNNFTIDGLTYTLHTTTHKDPADTSQGHNAPTQINVSRDTEKIVEGISEFLTLYNETMDYIYDLLKADATYKDYAPLTTAQKTEMSDREIEQWEEKSQEGLLRNDQYLQRIVQNMRRVMYSKPEGSSIAIYDLGISTSFYTNDGNLNAESLDDLRAAIEADPEGVQRLFSGEGGIMELLNTAINDATKSSYGSPGYLVAVAGTAAMNSESTISKQISEIDNQLDTLENRYWKEYDRYWKQFNAMEQMIQTMNSQSSWLSQQLGQ